MDAAHLTRCEELWFEDGTVVLRAEDTVFRVYRGMLCRQSSVFKDLFEVPQPANGECYEGCPLVHMEATPAEDLRDILLAIHDVDWPESITDNGVALAGLLELSKKYDFPNVRQRVTKILLATFPTTLAMYDALNAHHTVYTVPKRLISTIPELVALARVLPGTAPQFLPYTLWKLIRAPETDWGFVFAGVEGRGGRVFLPPNLQRALVQGRIALSTASRTTVFPQLFAPTPTNLHCDWQRLRLLPAIMKPDGYLDPIVEQPLDGLCEKCREVLREEAKVGRAVVWNRLPDMFGLGSWDDLARSGNEV
ncbi:BTB/POZ domain-containing protein [Phanerochaete sordida]|uniref:BTB/POZ domain-containing protein n=1 Tax=Phanerochaete sordida TaxID=48140 RepID=A0A9P3LDL3_9APHY|nr:BTB/POZ domain-containing protein [Phanerochaete sordida]